MQGSQTNTNSSFNTKLRLQKLGERIVGGFFMVLRSLKLYEIDNSIFAKPLQDFILATNELIKEDGVVSLLGADSTLYLNQQLLKFDRGTLDNVNYLLAQMEKRGLAGFRVETSVTMEHVQEFIRQFSPKFDGSSDTFIEGLKLEDVREKLRKIEEEELERLENQKADKKRYTILLYSRLLIHIRSIYGYTKEKRSSRVIVHTLQELIDLFYGAPVLFLGLTNEEDVSEYQLYHVANTIIFVIVFGEYLGLSKNQLISLSMLALYHDIGKLSLSSALLEKRTKLSTNDWKEIERLPIYSAQQILKKGFSWKAMEDAVAIVTLTQTPFEENTQDAEKPALSSVPFFTRIISLCSSFDALCTRRPYRLRFRPEDALMLMKTTISQQFDPYLLSCFVEFFKPILVNLAKQDRFQNDAPTDLRPPRKKNISSITQIIQKELNEFQLLRRIENPNQEQLHRIQFLKKFLIWKLKETIKINT